MKFSLMIAALALYLGMGSAFAAPLTEAALNPEEKALLQTLKLSPKWKHAFIRSRQYIREVLDADVAKLVKEFPNEPRGYNSSYHLKGEQAKFDAKIEEVLDAAATAAFAAEAALTPEEKALMQTLKLTPKQKPAFLEARQHIREILDGDVAKLVKGFPPQPRGFNSSYYLKGERVKFDAKVEEVLNAAATQVIQKLNK